MVLTFLISHYLMEFIATVFIFMIVWT